MTTELITKSTDFNSQVQDLRSLTLDAKKRYADVLPYLAAAAQKTPPDPYIDLESILAKVNELFEKIVKASAFFNTPIAAVKATAKIGTYFPVVKGLSSAVLRGLAIIEQPRQLIEFVSDVKKVASAFFGNNEKLAKNTAKLSALIFSIGEYTFETLSLLQTSGIFPALVAGGIPLSFLGAFCALISGLIHLRIKGSAVYRAEDFSIAKVLGLISSMLSAIKKGCNMKDWVKSPTVAESMKSIEGPLGGVAAFFGVVKLGYGLYKYLSKKPEGEIYVIRSSGSYNQIYVYVESPKKVKRPKPYRQGLNAPLRATTPT